MNGKNGTVILALVAAARGGAGTKADFVIYDEEFFGGMTEVLMQNSDAFNGASRNTIRLVPKRLKGDYEKESFVKEISGLISRRDVESVEDADDLKLEQGELIGVKINRKIGPVAQSRDAFRKIAEDPQLFSFLLGQQWGVAVAVDYINSAIRAVAAALSGISDVALTDYSGETLIHTYLAEALAKFGDNSKNILCWVMHSKVWYDLVKQSITDKITNVADVTIIQGTAATLGRPAVIIDSPSLVIAGTPSQYVTLGLVQDAVVVDESEERDIVSDVITGKENILMRLQGEYAYNLKVKGFAWNTAAGGGLNPSDSAVATDENWVQKAASHKSLAGVYLLTE